MLEVGTGFRAQRWATHEDELTGMLDSWRSSRGVAEAVCGDASGARRGDRRARKELARERGLVVFDTFERAAAAFRTASEYLENRARLGS